MENNNNNIDIQTGKLKLDFNQEENKINFGLINNFHNKDRIIQELHKLESLERDYGFLSSIQTKLLVPECANAIEGFMKAPDNSPYKDGIFHFIIRYPNDYPERAPEIILLTKIFHCNVYDDGRCCISHLHQMEWDKNYDISMILSFLFEFFIRNNPQDPCKRDFAEIYFRDYKLFLEKCQKYVDLYASKQLNERLYIFMFPNYSNVKLKFSNSNFIIAYNSKFITVSMDEVRDKDFLQLESSLGIDLRNKALIIGNEVFNSVEIERHKLGDYFKYHIIYVIPLIIT